jgi:hypothetical protein
MATVDFPKTRSADSLRICRITRPRNTEGMESPPGFVLAGAEMDSGKRGEATAAFCCADGAADGLSSELEGLGGKGWSIAGMRTLRDVYEGKGATAKPPTAHDRVEWLDARPVIASTTRDPT